MEQLERAESPAPPNRTTPTSQKASDAAATDSATDCDCDCDCDGDGDGDGDGDPRRTAGLACVVVGGALVALPASPLWVVLTGMTLAIAVGVPLLLAEHEASARRVLRVVVALVAVVAGLAAHARADGTGPVRDRTHDGGVIVTLEAARLAVRGGNPYTASFAGDLPPSWARVQGVDGARVANPVGEHDPYLAASFLVQVPFVVAFDDGGWTWDPRVLGVLTLAATAVLLARRPGPAWTRIGAVLTVGSAFTCTVLLGPVVWRYWWAFGRVMLPIFVLVLLGARREVAAEASTVESSARVTAPAR